MDKEEFIKKTKKEGIPRDSYCLNGGTPNDKYCINKKASTWEVYYSERGKKYKIEKFKLEKYALKNLYIRLKNMIDVMK